MRGNSFGKMLSITTFGESHGVALGAVVDGVPPGLSFSLADLSAELKKRAPGQLPGTTPEKKMIAQKFLVVYLRENSWHSYMCDRQKYESALKRL